MRLSLSLMIMFSPAFATAADAWEPRSAYREQAVEGWTVLINKQLDIAENRDLRDQTLKLLGDHLYRITRAVPDDALTEIRKIPIWVEHSHPKHPCMCFHVSDKWLKSNSMNPEKAGGVELANCRNFLEWTHAQPWMVLHELAHGYHHLKLGVDHPEIRACLAAAREAKLYDSVMHISGRKRKHYALTNETEYFAEMSEAYFGTNDFYPFVRAELLDADPRIFKVLEEVWGVKGRK